MLTAHLPSSDVARTSGIHCLCRLDRYDGAFGKHRFRNDFEHEFARSSSNQTMVGFTCTFLRWPVAHVLRLKLLTAPGKCGCGCTVSTMRGRFRRGRRELAAQQADFLGDGRVLKICVLIFSALLRLVVEFV